MSIETATQRLNTALGDLEAKVARRLDALESDVARLRGERDGLLSENQSLKVAAAAVPAGGSRGIDAHAHAVLAQTLADIDSLISRVSSAAQ
jgi:hypothetical protein